MPIVAGYDSFLSHISLTSCKLFGAYNKATLLLTSGSIQQQ